MGSGALMGDSLLDLPWKFRYGVGPAEKYRRAIAGEIPGAQPIHSEQDVEREERRASGYLFAQRHPTLAATVQPAVDALRTHVFRDDPSVVAAAQQGQRAAIGDVARGRVQQALFDTWDAAAAHFFGPGKR